MIVDLFFERNENALNETARKYGQLCHSVAHNVLGSHPDAEECVNDTYLALWNSIPPERPTHLKAFICKIARNLALKKLEYNTAAKRASNCVLSLSELDETIPDDRYAEDIAEAYLGELIGEFLREEKECARNVFIRRYYCYDGVGEIADMYGFSESKVKSMLFHTRNRLKKFLIERGVCI